TKYFYVKEKEIEEELVSIRSMMERSSKFISLSGLSGILAGVYALIGAGFAYKMLYNNKPSGFNPFTPKIKNELPHDSFYFDDFHNYSFRITIPALLLLAFLILIASIITAIILAKRKAKRKGQPIWGKISRALLFHTAIPLISGGVLTLIFISRGYYDIIAPATLVFYGLTLVSASNFTYTMVKYLGLCEIALGLIAACLPGYGLLFWAIGFGVLHIIYGSLMYFKYDK
ncbi:MAG: hypothetical protein ACHQIM_20365, partial [Sphingobacteriales bacterium]